MRWFGNLLLQLRIICVFSLLVTVSGLQVECYTGSWGSFLPGGRLKHLDGDAVKGEGR